MSNPNYKLETIKDRISQYDMRFPIATIVKETGLNKGYVSAVLNGKKPISDNFWQTFNQKFPEKKAPPNGQQKPSDLLTGAHVTLQDYINKIEEHNVFLQYVIKNGLVSLESNLKTGQLQIQEQLFAVGESLGNQLEGISSGLVAQAKDRHVARKDKDISGKQGGGDGKDKSRT